MHHVSVNICIMYIRMYASLGSPFIGGPRPPAYQSQPADGPEIAKWKIYCFSDCKVY